MKEINNNIQESYVSYEVGKLLKNKGFNWIYDEFNPDCNGEHSYFENINNATEIKRFSHYYIENNHNGLQWIWINVPAPTHSIAIEWFRINFGVIISTYPQRYEDTKLLWTYSIAKIQDGYLVDGLEFPLIIDPMKLPAWENPNEANEHALKFILEAETYLHELIYKF
jgi:hypothetical protein